MNNILLGIAIFFALIIVCLFSLPLMLDWNSYKDIVSQKIYALTSHHVEIKGDIEVRFLPIPSIYINDIYLYQDKTADDKVFYTKNLHLRLSLLPLINKEIDIQNIDLNEPHFIVRRTKEGDVVSLFQQVNEVEDEKSNNSKNFNQLFIGKTKIHNARATYIDEQNNKHYDITHINAQHRSDFINGPHQLEGQVTYQGQSLDFRLRFIKSDTKSVIKTVGVIAARDKSNTPKNSLRLDFDGSIKKYKNAFSQFNGKIKLRRGDINTVKKLLHNPSKQDDTDLQKDISYITSRVQLSLDTLHFEDLEMVVGTASREKKYKFQGKAELNITDRVMVKADFFTNFIDMGINEKADLPQAQALKKDTNSKTSFSHTDRMFFNPTDIPSFVYKIFSKQNFLLGKFMLDVHNFQYGKRLFKNVKLHINLSKQQSHALIYSNYGADGEIEAEFRYRQDEKDLLLADVKWKTSQLREDIIVFVPQELRSDFPYMSLPLNSTLTMQAQAKKGKWSLERASLQYGKKEQKIVYRQLNPIDGQTATRVRLDISTLHAKEIIPFVKWMNDKSLQAELLRNVAQQWIIKANNVEVNNTTFDLVQANLRVRLQKPGMKIILDNLSISPSDKGDIVAKAEIELDNKGRMSDANMDIRMNNIMIGNYFTQSIYTPMPKDFQNFIVNNRAKHVVAKLNMSPALMPNGIAITADVKAQMTQDASLFFTGYYESTGQNNISPEMKISISGFNLPSWTMRSYMPTHYMVPKEDKVDVNLYINKLSHQPTYNVTAKLRSEHFGYLIKADVKNQTNQYSPYAYTGVIQINNKDPWTGSDLVATEHKTDIIGSIELSKNYFLFDVQKGIFQGVPFTFSGEYQFVPEQKPRFQGKLAADYLSLPAALQLALFSQSRAYKQGDFWKSSDVLSLTEWEGKEIDINIKAKALHLSHGNLVQNADLTMQYKKNDLIASLDGRYNGGNIASTINARGNEEDIHLDGSINIKSEKFMPYMHAKTHINGHFSSHGNAMIDFIGNLKGHGNFHFIDGFIDGFNGNNFAQLGDWILTQPEAQFKSSLASLEGSSFKMPYKKLIGNFTIRDGLMSSRDIQLNSRYYSMNGTMFYDFNNMILDTSLDIHLKALPRAPTITLIITGSPSQEVTRKLDFTPLLQYNTIAQLEKNLIKTEKELEKLDKLKQNVINQ